MTKIQQKIYNKWLESDKFTLWDCYWNFSLAKESAYEDCRAYYEHKNGFGFKIISYNRFMFTIGYEFTKDGKTYFHYETPTTFKEWEI